VINLCRNSENIVAAASRARWFIGAGSPLGRERRSLPPRLLVEVGGVRRRVHAGAFLFLPGDRARYWYFLEAGCLRVFAPGADQRGSPAPLLGPASFFSFGSGGHHELVCEAIEASTVVCFDRRKVEGLAHHDPALVRLLENAARYELTLTLRCATAAEGYATRKRLSRAQDCQLAASMQEALEFSLGEVLRSRRRAGTEVGEDNGGRGAILSRSLRHGE
jgi:CRP-like cAMP-binding protein